MVRSQFSHWAKHWTILSVLLGGMVVTPIPALGAEMVYISFSLLEISLPVKSLEAFAKTGTLDQELAAYATYLNNQQLTELREALNARIELSPVAVSQFLYSPQGVVLLERLGRVIQTGARQQSLQAIRAALILAAIQPQGLTLLNILKQYPTPGLRIDLAAALTITRQIEALVRRSNQAIATVINQSQQEAMLTPADPSLLQPRMNLAEPGNFSFQTQTLQLNDLRRGRNYPADLYLPQGLRTAAPVIVISHGLGSNRLAYQYLAQHLASHGFVVAVPEHIGSNAAQQQALIEGEANEVAQPSEFIDRPLDVSFLLDELTRLSQNNPSLQGRFNLQQVGVIGQSFGGYTALALAGAEIDFELLQQECVNSQDNWNVSLLLQCRALELSGSYANLRDERVKSVIAISPFSSRVFGTASLNKIQIPVMIISGSSDAITPALPEQIQAFTNLENSAAKYLALIQGGSHFSTLQPTSADIPLPEFLLGVDRPLAYRYTEILSLAFFQSFVNQQVGYQRFLNANYIQSISRDIMPVFLIRDLNLEAIPQAPLGNF